MKKAFGALLFIVAIVTLTGWGGGWSGSGGGGGGGTLSGDVNGLSTANLVGSISGASPISISAAKFQWGPAVLTGPVLTQSAQTSDVATQPFTIQPQAPFSGASVNTAPASLILNEPPPVGSGVRGMVDIDDNASLQWAFGNGAAVSGGSSSASYMWGGPSVVANSSNFVIFANGSSSTQINAPSGGSVGLDVGGVLELQMTSTNTNFKQPVGGVSTVNAFTWCENVQAMPASGTTTLSNSVYNCPHLKFTGTVSGASTVVFPSSVGSCWTCDFSSMSGISGTNTITVEVGATPWSTVLTSNTQYPMLCSTDAGSGRLVGVLLSQ